MSECRLLIVDDDESIARTVALIAGSGGAQSRVCTDAHEFLDLARSYGIELPGSAAAAKVLDRLQQRGGARQDSAAVFGVLDDGVRS